LGAAWWIDERPSATLDEIVVVVAALAALGRAGHSDALEALRAPAGAWVTDLGAGPQRVRPGRVARSPCAPGEEL